MRKPSKVCAYPGCVNKAHAKGLCNKHYKRMRLTGNKLDQQQRKQIDWFDHPDPNYKRIVNNWFNHVIRDSQ